MAWRCLPAVPRPVSGSFSRHSCAPTPSAPAPPTLVGAGAAALAAAAVPPQPGGRQRPLRIYTRRSASIPQAMPPPEQTQAEVPWAPTLPRETRSRTGSLPPPIQRYGFSTASSTLASSLPANSRAALADPNWREAMSEEYKALMDNGTWRLVPRPPRANVITGKWVFRQKFHGDGSLAVIKLGGLFVVFRTSTTSTMTRCSVQLSNRPASASSSALPLLPPGRFISWT